MSYCIAPIPFDLAALVPEEYAAYRALIVDTLSYFVQALPPHRQRELLCAQQRLPTNTDAEHRLVTLLRGCPTLHKLGQVLARHRALSPELRRRLQELESLAPHTPAPEVHAAVQAELGRDAGGLTLRDVLAEGSVAVVVPYEEAQATARAGAPAGVLKILRSGIEARLAEDLSAWARLGDFLDERARHYDLAIDHRDTLKTVSELLTSEIDFEREQRNLAAAAAMLRSDPRVAVPGLLPRCTPRLTSMEYLPGVKVTAVHVGDASARRRMARALLEALVANPALALGENAVFHGDPHAGNLLGMPDGRVGVLDWSLGARLGRHEREQIVQFVLCALLGDAPGATRALAALATRVLDARRLHAAVAERLAHPPGRAVGLDRLLGLIDDVVRRGAVRFSADMLLLRKALLTLDGVLHDLTPGFSADDALIRAALLQFASELPQRWLAEPWSRAFGTRVSNMDLWQFGLTAGLQGARRWLETLSAGANRASVRSRG